MIDRIDENLAVADLTGLGRRRDGFNRPVDEFRCNGDFDLELRQEADGVFSAAIDFGMPLLATVALHFGHGQALNADRRQGFADLIELERLDNSHHNFHLVSHPSLSSARSRLSLPLTFLNSDRRYTFKGRARFVARYKLLKNKD
ncbi:hypothetical protein RHECNPAF_4460040 [Rhizobium etli CNPAF512]|nr:hypothetical protein RHECNPAF_4460040 [Rhizobium etli CNPAF512]